MQKGYWITMYRSISDPAAVARYADLAGPVIVASGGRFLARGVPSATYEGGLNERCVVIEFDSVAKAIATYESPAYQNALECLKGAAEREVRIIAGVSSDEAIN